jgi:SNF2 family DNA or RNA helicase
VTESIYKIINGGKEWEISAPPHVMMRLKNVFPKIDKRKISPVTLANTPDNTRDIQWFSERFSMRAFDEESREALLVGVDAFRQKEERKKMFLSPNYEPKPIFLRLPLRPYQMVAADVMVNNEFLLLGDQIGLGKTATAIGAVASRQSRPVLVVCQTQLVIQWAKDEIPKFIPEAQICIIKKGTPYKLPAADFYVINYSKLSGWAQTMIETIGIQSVIFDEVQELRHDGSGKYNAAKFIASGARFRYGLSATPVYNYGDEIFNIMEVLSPGCLGEFSEFDREWCSYSGANRVITQPKAFGAFLKESSLMIARTREDVGRELPPVTRMVQTIEVNEKALDSIRESVVLLAKQLLYGQFTHRGQAARQIDMRMRQATGIAKAPYVAEFAKTILERGDKLVIFLWHHEVYEILKLLLKEYRPVLYMGAQSSVQKNESKRRFMLPAEDPESSQVILMSLRAAPGLNGLQDVCSCCIYAELDWSPMVHQQDTGRIQRERTDGKENKVLEIFLLSEDGSDPVIADILRIKEGQSYGIMRPESEEEGDIYQSDPERIKKLVTDYLKRHHIEITKDAELNGESVGSAEMAV